MHLDFPDAEARLHESLELERERAARAEGAEDQASSKRVAEAAEAVAPAFLTKEKESSAYVGDCDS